MTARRERQYFDSLELREQKAAIRKLVANGLSDYGAWAATGLSVEQVRRIVADHEPGASVQA